MTIAELLAMSKASHDSYKRAALVKGAGMDFMEAASRLRKQAIEMDPQRTDPAWAAEDKMTSRETNTHDALTEFYASKGF